MYVLYLLLSVLSVKSGWRWRCHLGRRWVERVWAQRWEHLHCRSRCFHDCCCGCWDDCHHCSHCWTHATDYIPHAHVPHVTPIRTLMSCKRSQIHKHWHTHTHTQLHTWTNSSHMTKKKKKKQQHRLVQWQREWNGRICEIKKERRSNSRDFVARKLKRQKLSTWSTDCMK